jgi:hypothetical protein
VPVGRASTLSARHDAATVDHARSHETSCAHEPSCRPTTRSHHRSRWPPQTPPPPAPRPPLDRAHTHATATPPAPSHQIASPTPTLPRPDLPRPAIQRMETTHREPAHNRRLPPRSRRVKHRSPRFTRRPRRVMSSCSRVAGRDLQLPRSDALPGRIADARCRGGRSGPWPRVHGLPNGRG